MGHRQKKRIQLKTLSLSTEEIALALLITRPTLTLKEIATEIGTTRQLLQKTCPLFMYAFNLNKAYFEYEYKDRYDGKISTGNSLVAKWKELKQQGLLPTKGSKHKHGAKRD